MLVSVMTDSETLGSQHPGLCLDRISCYLNTALRPKQDVCEDVLCINARTVPEILMAVL